MSARRSRRPDRGGARARLRQGPRDDRRAAEELLVRAQSLLARGEAAAALATAGEAVRLDRNLLDAYLLIGDVCLLEDDLPEAERVFAGVVRKARRRVGPGGGPGPDADAAGELLQEALARHGTALYLSGRFEEAAGVLGELLGTRPPDPGGVGQLLAEVRLHLGDPAGALELLPDDADAPAETHLVAALAHVAQDDWSAAVPRIRQAFLANLYLLSQLLDEEPPDFGLTHGTDEATAEHAEGVAARLALWFHRHEDQLDQLAGVAATAPVQREVEELVETARALNREADPDRRRALVATLARLRDPQRLRDTTPAVLAALEADDDPAAPPPFAV